LWTEKDRRNLSSIDLVFYPFVWTFARRADMLGNISPLFLGLVPFIIAYRNSSVMRPALIAGLAGLIAWITWLSIHPLILFTRWLLVPLALVAVCLSAAVVAAEKDLRQTIASRWIFGSAILALCLFLLFQSRGVFYAVRYVAAIDSRSARYASMPGFDVASWINTHVNPGQRVALAHWIGYPYFLELRHLLNSESQAELQEFWERHRSLTVPHWTAEIWRFYKKRGFTYVVVRRNLMDEAWSAWSKDSDSMRLTIEFVGKNDAVFKIEEPIYVDKNTGGVERL
jgi:hypothetical protein